MVRTRLYRNGRLEREDLALGEVDGLVRQKGVTVRVDYTSPTTDDLARTETVLGLHRLAAEDAVHEHQRPKLDRYPTHLFLAAYNWGQSEDDWTPLALTALDQALADAAALGITVTAAEGDNGSAEGATDGKDHADFPASSPHVLACGGTRLDADPATGKITAETVWNDGPNSSTGGGYSDAFPVPAWQTGHTGPARHHKPRPHPRPAAPGRGVPDVSGVADPQTGYKARVDGKDLVIGGTSAVAPLWAALIARLAQAGNHPFGLIQAILYAHQETSSAGFRDITTGNNGSYTAAPGSDPCTGLGSPDSTALLNAVQTRR